jgi:hypothetical protein
MQRDARIVGVIHRRCRGTPINGGDPTGVAMGQQTHRIACGFARGDILDQLQPVKPDLAVNFDVFIRDLVGKL